MKILTDVAAVIATKNRAGPLRQTLESLAAQSVQPNAIVIVDGSNGSTTRHLCVASIPNLGSRLIWQRATKQGAAAQRNQGIAATTHPLLWLCDDDIRVEPDCIINLWKALNSESRLGGVNATITNQQYQPPGFVSRTTFMLIHGRREKSYAGKLLGPAVNLLPEDNENLPEIVPVEWLNTTCTLYRREALPEPPFDDAFSGYSMLEDVALSYRVSKGWRLANVRNARIFHDSQPGPQKSDPRVIARMELRNRHYVMKNVLGRDKLSDYGRLLLWECFQLAAAARPQSVRTFAATVAGKWAGLRDIVTGRDKL